MKTHLVKKYFETGERTTHFKTACGKIRHLVTNLPHTRIKKDVTCNVCDGGIMKATKEMKTLLKSFQLYYHDEYGERIISGAIDNFIKFELDQK